MENDKKISETKETKKVKEPSYPKWESGEKAEIGVKYIDANGNLIQKGTKSDG